MPVQSQPAGAPDATGRRILYLPAAVLGNGSLLATLSARGEVERLFWPHVDHGQHLGELRLGVSVEGRTLWLDEEPFAWEQSYVEDANALRTVARSDALEVEVLDVVSPHAPVLARRVRTSEPLRVVVYCRPQLDESTRYGTAYVEPSSRSLVFYRRDRALAIGATALLDAACSIARPGEPYSARADAEDGALDGDTVAHGEVDGAAVTEAAEEVLVVAAFGTTPEEALTELDAALATGAAELLDERLRHDAERLTTARPPNAAVTDAARDGYRRSLLTLDLMADRTTGGVIAAPEFDPDFTRSGGYGFVWGRDLAFVILSFLAAGRDDLARDALRWLATTQAPEGLWLQRHWTTGEPAPSWGLHQVDETGAILFACEAAHAALSDPVLDVELWPSVRAGAEFLCGFLDPATGLPRASFDLWEEREGQHAYTAAAVYGGLKAAARFAARREPALTLRYDEAAEGVRDAIQEHLWSDLHGRFLRSLWVGRGDELGVPVPDALRSGLPYPNRRVHSADPEDACVDISLLGLAWPFRAVDPASPRMQATARAIERTLRLENGGVVRYEGDAYAGGNPWILTTLWLGLWYREIGDEVGYARCVEYALAHRTANGLLPEQVTRDGRPAWVIPLGWSHAMLLLALRPDVASLEPVEAAATARAPD